MTQARILIVDDEPANRRVLRAILQRAGYATLEASTGAGLVERLVDERPSLVLLDILLPELDGYAVYTRLRERPELEDIPVIFVSSRDRTADKVRAFELGAADYVTKPFDPEEVLARVRTHLRLRQLNRELKEHAAVLEEDLRAAAEIQRALIPRKAPEIDELAVTWRYETSGAVGGDLFYVQRLDDRYVSAYVLDVSGHSAASAMVTASVAQTLTLGRGFVRPQGAVASPLQVLYALDREYPFERFERFFTIAYVLIDLQTRRMTYSSAAHPAPLLVRRTGAIERLDRGGPLLGLGLASGLSQTDHGLSPGDRLYLFTDGFIEQPNGNGEQFGEARLEALLADRTVSIDDACSRVVEEVRAHAPARTLADDCTVLAIEFGMGA